MKEMYKGTVQGYHGPVTATITIEDGKIIQAESQHSKDAHIGTLGINRMIERITETQTLEVDTVSGATFSSAAYLKAAKKAVAVSRDELSQDDASDMSVELKSQESEAVDVVSGASITSHDEENTSIARKPVYLTEDLTFDAVYDVIIAGSGGAGLSAAVESARGGLNTLVCEKAGIPGGTTNGSGGVIQAAGTKYQKALTPFKNDTPQKHAKLWSKAGEGNANEDLVWDLALGAPDNIEWLADMGIEWEKVYGHSHIPTVEDELHADRIHQYKGGGGGGQGTILTLTLLNEFEKNGGQIEYDCPVVALIRDKNSNDVAGVIIEKDGKDYAVKANKGVILATASVDHNPALAKDVNAQQYHDISHSTLLSSPYDTGDGIIMGMSVGGAIAGMGGTIDFCSRTGNATNNSIPTIPLIYVNGVGKRFVCEDATYAYHYRAIFQETQKHAAPTYMILGADSIKEPGSAWTNETLAADVASGLVKKAETIDALAEITNVPAQNLKETLEQWNKYATEGNDPEFGRIQGIKAITGPYYAMKNKATNLGSLGGMKINTDSQVLDNFGEPIKGLYAAGLNAGGWVTGYYPGSGTAIAGIVHQGRKAGKHLASQDVADKHLVGTEK